MAELLSFLEEGRVEAGVDEAGRGCLSGPVVASAVILPEGWNHPLLNDSKQLTEKKRELLRPIIEAESLSWGVGFVFPERIDEINILQASFEAMHIAIRQLSVSPDHILVDGNRFRPFEQIAHTCVIKGDGKIRSIAAASVLAKTHRDEYMEKIHQEFPMFDWCSNKGYPTKKHREIIASFGPTPYHRKSFALLPKEL